VAYCVVYLRQKYAEVKFFYLSLYISSRVVNSIYRHIR